jgi:uncharacterized membrane protein HdeD (DUF308 family)
MSENIQIKQGVSWSIVISLLIIAAGAVAIIVPPASGIAVAIFVGWLLVFCGIAHFVYAWHTRHGGGVLWGILLGIVYVFAGGYILLHPVAGLASLTFLLAAYLFIEAIMEFILSFELRRVHGSGWLLLDGIITLALALMIWWSWPASTEWVIGTLVGISLIFTGITRLAISMAARHGTKPLTPMAA